MEEIKNSNKVDYSLIAGLLLMSSGSNFFSSSEPFLVFFMLFSFYIFIKRKLELDILFLFLLLFYLSWIIGISVKHEKLFMSTYLGFLIRILLAYFIVKCLNKNFLPYLIKVIYYLALISIPLFVIQVIIPGTFFKINSIFSLIPIFAPRAADFSNSFVFTFTELHSLRNSGFMWEPGAYASILIVTMIFHLAINGIKFSKEIVVFTIALITTFSTTGYVTLAFIILFIIYNGPVKIKLIGLAVVIPLSIYVFNLDIVSKKISDEIKNSVENIDKSYEEVGGIAQSRTTGTLKDWEDFKKNYFLGMGINDETRYTDKFDITTRANGISDWAVKFGLPGLLVLLFNYFLSFHSVINSTHLKGGGIIALTIITVSISEPLPYLPLFFTFQYLMFAKEPLVEQDKDLKLKYFNSQA